MSERTWGFKSPRSHGCDLGRLTTRRSRCARHPHQWSRIGHGRRTTLRIPWDEEHDAGLVICHFLGGRFERRDLGGGADQLWDLDVYVNGHLLAVEVSQITDPAAEELVGAIDARTWQSRLLEFDWSFSYSANFNAKASQRCGSGVAAFSRTTRLRERRPAGPRWIRRSRRSGTRPPPPTRRKDARPLRCRR